MKKMAQKAKQQVEYIFWIKVSKVWFLLIDTVNLSQINKMGNIGEI
jgi:hypothetical protein